MKLTLPYPPSVNHYWRMARGRFYISPEGRAYRDAVILMLLHMPDRRAFSKSARLKVSISLHPPDRRRRDLDNALKAILDALQYAGVYADDCQIDDLHIVRAQPVKPGVATVSISQT